MNDRLSRYESYGQGKNVVNAKICRSPRFAHRVAITAAKDDAVDEIEPCELVGQSLQRAAQD